MKTTAVIEDFSGIGNMSLAAALDILHALGITTAAMPATILSTQTEGFGTPAQMTPLDFQRHAFAHWQSLADVDVSSVLVGYLGQPAVVENVVNWLKTVDASQVVVDPVMGDQGQLYPGLSAGLPAAMRKLVKSATVITPNATELALLTGRGRHEAAEPAIKEGVSRLWQGGYRGAIVVTGLADGGEVRCQLWPGPGQGCLEFASPQLPGHFYGTGDAFAALLSGLLTCGLPLAEAVGQANRLLQAAVRETARQKEADRKFGLQLRQLLGRLSALDFG